MANQSDDYKRGYSKGYTAGCRRSDPEIAKALEMADHAAKRAERAEKAQGVGHCEDCAYWHQGDKPRHGWESCAWGICRAPRAAGTPWGTWSSVDTYRRERMDIQTTPRFGCVVFMKAP
jgi:hypothetical protein